MVGIPTCKRPVSLKIGLQIQIPIPPLLWTPPYIPRSFHINPSSASSWMALTSFSGRTSWNAIPLPTPVGLMIFPFLLDGRFKAFIRTKVALHRPHHPCLNASMQSAHVTQCRTRLALRSTLG